MTPIQSQGMHSEELSGPCLSEYKYVLLVSKVSYGFILQVVPEFQRWNLSSPSIRVTGIAMWLHRGALYLANKSGSVKEPVVINLILGGNLFVPK